MHNTNTATVQEDDEEVEEVIANDVLFPPRKNLIREVRGAMTLNLESVASHERTKHHLSTILRPGSEDNYFALLRASSNGHIEEVQRILESISINDAVQRNPRIESSFYGLTPLHVAKTREIIKLLLDYGFPIEFEASEGQRALHAHHSHPEILKYLIERGADVNAQILFTGASPLHWAVAADNVEAVEILVQSKANVNIQNHSGNTPLHLVLSLEVAKVLTEAGARIYLTNENGHIPAEEAATRAFEDPLYDVAIFLLDMSRQSVRHRQTTRKKPPKKSESYQKKLTLPNQDATDGPAFSQSKAKERWNLVKRAFLTHHETDEENEVDCEPDIDLSDPFDSNYRRGHAGIDNSENAAKTHLDLNTHRAIPINDSDQDTSNEFYHAFFELMVRERPGLALKVLDKQRTFLHWENASQVYRYHTELLGSLSCSSRALKLMVILGDTKLISHPVVQYVMNMRWILFTRESLWFEFCVHLLFLGLLVASSFSGVRRTDLTALAIWNPYEGPDGMIIHVIIELMLMWVNLRYIVVQVSQARLIDFLQGVTFRWYHVGNSTMRNESLYILPHICVFLSQMLRLVSGSETVHLLADLMTAIVSWRFFYRTMSFVEGFESLGVAMSMIRSMMSENLIYFAIFLMFVTGFSHSMYLVFHDETENPQYGSFTLTWITLFFFAFNLDLGEIYIEKNELRKYVGFFVLAMYMCVTVAVCFNLIIALMTNTFEKVKTDSRGQWLLQRAKLVLFYEQYDLALNSVLHKIESMTLPDERSTLHENLRKLDMYPAGNSKHFVKETRASSTEKYVVLEVPKDVIRQCVEARDRHFSVFLSIRWYCFKMWKVRLRRSKSFLWPDKNAIYSNCESSSTKNVTPRDKGHDEKSDAMNAGYQNASSRDCFEIIGGYFVHLEDKSKERIEDRRLWDAIDSVVATQALILQKLEQQQAALLGVLSHTRQQRSQSSI